MEEFDSRDIFFEAYERKKIVRLLPFIFPFHEAPPHSPAPTVKYTADSFLSFTEYSESEEIPHPLSSMSKTEAPTVEEDNVAWNRFRGPDCKSCLTLRQVVHASECYTMKLSLHVYSRVLHHAKLVVHRLIDDILEQEFIADLRSVSVESVQCFLTNYGKECVRDGLELHHDSLQPFFEVLMTQMDYPNHHINPLTLMEFQERSPFQNPCNFSEYFNMNMSEVTISKTRLSIQSSNKTRKFDGVRRDAGHTKQVLERTQQNQKIDITVQRKRTMSMTYDDIAKFFHLPIVEASKELQICPTALKKICRRYNINRWPHRKVVSTAKRILTLKDCIKYEDNGAASKKFHLLQNENRELENIYVHPVPDQAK